MFSQIVGCLPLGLVSFFLLYTVQSAVASEQQTVTSDGRCRVEPFFFTTESVDGEFRVIGTGGQNEDSSVTGGQEEAFAIADDGCIYSASGGHSLSKHLFPVGSTQA